MLFRKLLFLGSLLSAHVTACQPIALPQALGPTAVLGQPGQWQGPVAAVAAASQKITARVVPFWQGGKYGLLTPQGRVILAATSSFMPQPVSRSGHVWAASAPAGAAGRLVLLTDSGRVLGYFEQAQPAGGRWGWVQALGARHTITLFDSVGYLLRATPYGKLEEPHENLLVMALPDSTLPGTSGAVLPGRRGLLDQQAREVVPPRYRYLASFSHGYAPIAEDRGPRQPLRHGVLDHQGHEHWLGTTGSEAALRYQGGFFSGYSNDKGAAIALGIDGQVLVPYTAGLSRIERTQSGAPGGLIEVRGQDRSVLNQRREGWGLYDTLLRPTLPPRYQGLREGTRDWIVFEDFAATGLGAPDLPRKGAAWHGRLAVPATYSNVQITPDGRFALAGGWQPDTRTVVYALSERGGPLRLLPGYTAVNYLGHGVLAVQQGGRWGLLRTDGQVLRPCRDEQPLTELQQGLYFSQGPGPWNLPLADTLGRVVLPAGKYETAACFTPTLAWVQQQGSYGICNLRTGQVVVPPCLAEPPRSLTGGSYWGHTTDGTTLIGHDAEPPIRIAGSDFQPVSIQWPYLIAGIKGRNDWQLYNGQGQLLSTEVTRLEGSFRNGVIWAGNAAGRYALLDTRGRALTPFRYQLIMDLRQNWAPFGGGLGLARTEAGTTVVVDCFGREYAW
ncbi:WG repeat-containing protein [Hymenobacter setariae]|uniref:WG repeat-containing protein n=1 Tax=Hymenobacter setariae TaxID=2594794 RepID=A0A558BWA0_9BACT|nr:WG repeat-containing protein [Hymenobacter setariae]